MVPPPMGADSPPRLLPDDEHNRALVSEVRPPAWRNPTPAGRYNLVVVGAGTAGLVSAAGAAGLGARVALVERHVLGGDCLNVGCVPSKAIIAAARVAADAREAAAFGVHVPSVDVDFPAVMARMRRLRARLAPTDGARRFAGLGVDVLFGAGRFTGPTTLEVDGRRLEFARAVIATGARATAPPIPGLADAGYLTNETVFELTELPRRLAIVGAGPIGCELAQAFQRLGSRVTALEVAAQVLGREDPDAAAIVERRLRTDGVEIVLGARIVRAERRGTERILVVEAAGATREIACDAILVGAGRAPNVEDLGLEAAGVAYEREGVTVDDHLRTTNRRIYAAGDVASRFRFTHVADATARIVIQNALFLGRKKASALHVPWCTYTAPEVAHVGLTARDAAERGVALHTITVPLAEVDRAVLEGAEDGFLRVHLKQGSDTILGATFVGAHAGETISELTLAMTRGIGLAALAGVVHPYPTVAEAIRKAADAFNRTRLTPSVKRLFRWWLAARR
jgi:pyruvate/2-oxoglutarate dehydrogenase complex dihydrolipoamide dehydrogenase (E3) component